MKRPLTIMLVLTAPACGLEKGTAVELLFVQKPESVTCGYSDLSVQSVGFGYWDPSGADTYTMGIVLQNHLATAAEDEFTTDTGANVRVDANNVVVLGFEGCWWWNEDTTVPVQANQSPLVDCDELPQSNQAFITATGKAAAGGGVGVSVFEAFDMRRLQALFGEAFEPAKIPPKGSYIVDSNGDGDFLDDVDQIYYSWGSQDPTDRDTRSEHWGNLYPTVRETEITIQVQAVVKNQTGKTFRSTWLNFTIGICVGCKLTECGDMGQKQCTNACLGGGCPVRADTGLGDDADVEEQRRCVLRSVEDTADDCATHCDNNPNNGCTPFAFEGFEPRVRQCLLFQGVGSLICQQVDQCITF